MKKYLLVLVGLCCVLSYALAERPDYPELKKSDANIIGHVLDKKTKEHLPYITIALKGTTIGTVTDATGHYFLKNLPEGNFILEVSSVGYKTVTRNVTLKKGKTLEEDFEIEEDAIALDGVVVSANRSETTRRMAPTLVNVVDLKLFETTNSSTLSQGLNFQPGVRVETNCQNCGFQQVRINGLDGPYTQILIDSRPVFSALSGSVSALVCSGVKWASHTTLRFSLRRIRSSRIKPSCSRLLPSSQLRYSSSLLPKNSSADAKRLFIDG